MSRRLALALVSILGGCTFNVSSFTRDVSSQAPDVPSHLSADFAHAPLSGFGIRVEGSDTTTTTTSAVVTVAGLLGAGADPDAIARGVHIDWPADDAIAGGRRLTIGYDGPALETVWSEGALVTLPATTGLELTLGSTSAEVSGVSAPMHLVAGSGSIDVRGAGEFTLEAGSGSIDVGGHTGTVTCSSGSIALALDGAVIAHAASGSIAGRFGAGGELAAESGSLDLELVCALDRDLTLSAGSGSIHLTVPRGSSMRVETHTGSGSSSVDVGTVHSGDDFTGTIGSGGFLVRATTGSGSIVIDER